MGPRACRPSLAPPLLSLLLAACASAPPPPPPAAAPKPPPDWIRSRQKLDGTTVLVRIHEAVRERAGDAEFPHRVTLIATYSTPPAHPLPTREQKVALRALEEALLAEVGESSNHHLAAIVTGGGERRFIFYTARPAAFDDVLTRLRQRAGRFPLRLVRAEDPAWRLFRSLRAGGGAAR